MPEMQKTAMLPWQLIEKIMEKLAEYRAVVPEADHPKITERLSKMTFDEPLDQHVPVLVPAEQVRAWQKAVRERDEAFDREIPSIGDEWLKQVMTHVRDCTPMPPEATGLCECARFIGRHFRNVRERMEAAEAAEARLSKHNHELVKKLRKQEGC